MYGGSDPPQLPLFKVTSISLLFCIRVGLKPYEKRPRTRCAEINSKIQNITLSSTSWSGSSAPYSYTITLSSTISSNSQIELSPGINLTTEQANALLAAGICSGTINTSNKQIVIKAYGKKPSVNIPINISIKEA